MSQRYGLSSENKGAADVALDFPKLSLKKGEVARLALFTITTGEGGKKELALPEPEGGYFWSIRKPNGDFAGSFECLASEEAKRADEFDADGCPHCAAVLEGAPSDVIEPRKRRFVMHVVRYRTAPGSARLLEPYSVEATSWVFGDRYFNQLVDEHEKWAQSGGLLGHDLTVTCEVEQFQNHKLSVEPEAAWRTDKGLMQLVVGTHQSALEMAPSLRRKLGTTLTKEQTQAKIQEALRLAHLVDVGSSAPVAVAADPELIGGLAEELFGSSGPATAAEIVPEAAPAPAAAPAEDLSALAAPAAAPAPEAVPAPAAPVAEPVAEPVAVPDVPAAPEGELDFDSFFNAG